MMTADEAEAQVRRLIQEPFDGVLEPEESEEQIVELVRTLAEQGN